jgi:hypothetical protein
MFISYTEKLRVDFVLAFLKLFKQKTILIDKTFSAGKIGFFKWSHPEVGINTFLFFFLGTFKSIEPFSKTRPFSSVVIFLGLMAQHIQLTDQIPEPKRVFLETKAASGPDHKQIFNSPFPTMEDSHE